MKPLERRVGTIAAGVGLLLVLLICVWIHGGSSIPTDKAVFAASSSRADPVRDSPVEAPAVTRSVREVGSPTGSPGGTTYEFVDGTGAPIGDVEVLTTALPRARTLPVPRRENVLARSARNGQVTLDAAQAALAAWARRSGFIAREVPRQQGSESITRVEMAPSSRVVFSCRDTEGEPVTDVLVAMSRCGLPNATTLSETAGQCAGMACDAVFSASSGADGVASIEDLRPGRYGVAAIAEGWSLTSPPRAVDAAVGETHRVDIVLSRPRVAILSVRGDRVLGMDSTWGSGDWVSQVFYDANVSQVEQRVQERFPEATVLVHAPRKRIVPQTIPVKILLEHAGLVPIELAMMPEELALPQVFDASRLPAYAKFAQATLTVIDPIGAPITTGSAQTTVMFGDQKLHVTVPIDGTAFALPAGRYRLQFGYEDVGLNLEPEEIQVPGTNVLRTDRVLVPVTVNVRNDAGNPIEAFGARIDSGGSVCNAFHERCGGTIRLRLPLGSARVQVQAPGCKSVMTTFEVTQSAEEARFEIILPLANS